MRFVTAAMSWTTQVDSRVTVSMQVEDSNPGLGYRHTAGLPTWELGYSLTFMP